MSVTPAAQAAGLEFDTVESIPAINADLRRAFLSGKTRNLEYRKDQLKQLSFLLRDNEDAWVDALAKDLGRSKFETMFAELLVTITEAVEAVNHLEKWAKKEKVAPGLAWGFHNPHVRREPKGSVLILGAWNYPVVSRRGNRPRSIKWQPLTHMLGARPQPLSFPCRPFKLAP